MWPLAQRYGLLAMACVLIRSASAGDGDTNVIAERDVPSPVKSAAASKLALLAKMLEGDTLRRRIDAGNNAVAREQFERARTVHGQAVALQSKGDFTAADAAANDALRLLREALKSGENRPMDETSLKADYNSRRERVLGFREAYLRIQAEKTRSRGGALDEGQIDTLVREADVLARQGRYQEGAQVLGRASTLLEATLTRLRDKETLVHELKFASPEEELQYERNRNHSYELLLDLVTSEKQSPQVRDLVARAKSQNLAAREHADAVAGNADISGALRILEGATSTLAQTLRAAGVPVP